MILDRQLEAQVNEEYFAREMKTTFKDLARLVRLSNKRMKVDYTDVASTIRKVGRMKTIPTREAPSTP